MTAAELELLLAEDAWMRRLASRLVSEGGEDLVQEAWVQALERGAARELRAPRAWLAALLRNLGRARRRGEARRALRERAAARQEGEPGPDQLVAELALRKEVAAALLELEEPYRAALYLRFYQDCALADVAARTRVPLSTAHARVQRGIELLRARLDRAHGGERRTWALGLAALARGTSGTAPGASARTITGGTLVQGGIMALVLKLFVGGMLVAGALWWWPSRGRMPASEETASATAGATLAREPDAAGRAPAPAARSPLPEEVQPPAPAASAPLSATFVGRAVDTEGHAVGALAIAMEAKAGVLTTTSAADGAFTFAIEESDRWARIRSADPAWRTLVPGTGLRGEERLLVVARSAAFAGHVVDGAGAPVAEAELSLRVRTSLFGVLAIEHPQLSAPPAWATRSGVDGAFALPELAGGPHLALAVRAPGFVERELELAPAGDPALWIALEPDSTAVDVDGFVVDDAGAPVAGAQVSLGRALVRTDEEGAFHLTLDAGTRRFVVTGAEGQRAPEDPPRVIALAPGHLPASAEVSRAAPTAELVLVLGAAPKTISGRVVDPAGAGLPGVIVWPRELTSFAFESNPELGGRELTVEDALAEQDSGWFGTVTDAAGAFELGSLIERGYDLRLFESGSATYLEVAGVAAGAHGLELVLAPEPGTRRVAGRVVTAAGEPRAGISVRPRRTESFASLPPQLVGGEYWVETDSEGRFEFPRLATVGTSLDVQAMPMMVSFALEGEPDLERLELVVPRMCLLQVVCASAIACDSFGVLDAAGRELVLSERIRFGGNSIAMTIDPRVELTEGRSNVAEAPETARTLVLYRAGEEVLRLALALDPDELTLVNP